MYYATGKRQGWEEGKDAESQVNSSEDTEEAYQRAKEARAANSNGNTYNEEMFFSGWIDGYTARVHLELELAREGRHQAAPIARTYHTERRTKGKELRSQP